MYVYARVYGVCTVYGERNATASDVGFGAVVALFSPRGPCYQLPDIIHYIVINNNKEKY